MEQVSEKPDKSATANLAIAGAAIRTVRENKKLTQLYVANFVGVTTDTISRWENNRYPSIKRDNAEKLALALEVELSEILRPEEVAEPSEVVLPASSPSGTRRLWFLGLVLSGLLTLSLYFFTRPSVPALTAVRWAPKFSSPGEIIPVQVKVSCRNDRHSGFILKEKLPDGFRLVSALPPPSGGGQSGSGVKWLIRGGSDVVTVSYTVQVASTAPPSREAKLSGEVVLPFGGTNRTDAVGGNSAIRIGPYHWADLNGDGRIDDDEIMPAYYLCEEMKGLGLDWKGIEAIWSGKGYRWDAAAGFTPLK